MMSPKLYSWLDVYVKNYWKWATKDRRSNSRVFVTWGGGNFHYSGDVSTQINSLWHQAGMKKKCGANMFRKAAVSATRESAAANDNAYEDLTNLMGHKKNTAEKYYYMQNKLDSARRAGKLLPATMRSGKKAAASSAVLLCHTAPRNPSAFQNPDDSGPQNPSANPNPDGSGPRNSSLTPNPEISDPQIIPASQNFQSSGP